MMGDDMAIPAHRRDLLKGALALGGVAALGPAMRLSQAAAQAAPLQVPAVDRLSVRVVLDSAHDIFLAPNKIKDVAIERAGRTAEWRRTLHNQWGLSLLMESSRGTENRTVLLDFGYTPEALLNNIELLGIDVKRIDALVVSHGHYDHFGGLSGFLQKHRASLPADLTLYAGGEHNFCPRHQRAGTPDKFSEWGVLDRKELAGQNVKVVLAEKPMALGAGHAFTTGPVQSKSFERVLPNTMVEYAMKDGVGCDLDKLGARDKAGKILPDEHDHEHSTCYNVRGKGLVVSTSCGHRGMINAVRQAMAATGVDKLHAVLGGFHLGPAQQDYANQTVAELKKINPDVVIPMHCSGNAFIKAMQEHMPDKLLLSTTGSRITFTA
jgi:7,8-dihydropterin-6-yl-methyl-4-(beta-D-ribofuranosyl)aminobenzene 5'-phosphate synthase